MEKELVYRVFKHEDTLAVKRFVKHVFPNFLGGDYWEWKYLNNPSFSPDLVGLVEKDDKIVGCDHWLPRRIKLSSSLVADVFLGGDFAVDPEYRKHGVGKSLLLFMRKSCLPNKKGAVMNYMFADPELSKRLYQPALGYVRVKTSTVTYTKRLSWTKIIRKLEETKLTNSNLIDEGNLKVKFQVLGAPQLTVRISRGGIRASEGSMENVDVEVESNMATLISLRKKEKRTRNLLKAILTRKLKVKGSLTDIIRFYRKFRLLQEILAQCP